MIRIVMLLAVLAGPAAALTLDEALETARANHPELAAADEIVASARAAGEQAGAWPNPAGFLHLEAAPRDGNAWDGAERIAGLSQALPLGGRTALARRAAQAAHDRTVHEREMTRSVVEAEVRAAFAEAVHAREGLRLVTEAKKIARRLRALVVARVDAGEAPAAELSRADMELGAAEAEALAAAARDRAARIALAAAIGAGGAPTAPVVGGMSPLTIDLETLLKHLDEMPAARVAASRVAERAAIADEASRRRIPDLEIEAGLRTAPDGESFDVGVRVDLPLFDRGGARLASAKAAARAEAHLAQAAKRDLETALRRAHAEFEAASRGADLYANTVAPAARAALSAAEAAFDAGDTGLTEVLLAKRDFMAARHALLDLRRDAALAHADLLALM